MNLKSDQVAQTAGLLNEGATIPFIARYRKEATGGLDEVAIAGIRDRLEKLKELDKRRETILNSIDEQGKLTPELEEKINRAATMAELEDLYLPYRPKRRTRATIAVEKGLEPLARIIMAQNSDDIATQAARFVNPQKGVNNVDEAIRGACDIVAEWMNERPAARRMIRGLLWRKGIIASKVIKGKEADGANYQNYFDHSELISRAPSHRILAMFRGEKEGILRLSVAPPEQEALEQLERYFVKSKTETGKLVADTIRDAYRRLMLPSLETEIRKMAKEKADRKAVDVFSQNLRQLLMAPPLGQKRVLAVDPGFSSGCKVVCLDAQGNLLHNETIYPHPPQNEIRQSISKISQLVQAYKIEAIAIGNGTAGRETENMFRKIRFDRDVMVVVVNESGASVYSASKVAREEFPDYDVTVRGAVSIGRRLMDPLAELVKIDPKSIGVGQYQHDVDQKMLEESLHDTVMSCVNAVGVELNTASRELLAYVSGIGPALAGKIIEWRKKNGPFKNREELKKVPRLGEKAFEQAAGFLRIRNSTNPLDESAVHPESYHIVERMAADMGCSVKELIGSKELTKKIDLTRYISGNAGLPTLKDIIDELEKPGRDPREKFGIMEFDKNIRTIDDLKEGMELPGIITNVTAFGAFVDIGIKQNGLIHISKLSDGYVSDPNAVVSLNQHVLVRVEGIDHARQRINLRLLK